MKYDEYCLMHTAEECAEVIQLCAKTMRFGRDEIRPGETRSNGERLREEILDVVSMVGILQKIGIIRGISADDIDDHIASKEAKRDKYLAYSRQLGKLDE